MKGEFIIGLPPKTRDELCADLRSAIRWARETRNAQTRHALRTRVIPDLRARLKAVAS